MAAFELPPGHTQQNPPSEPSAGTSRRNDPVEPRGKVLAPSLEPDVNCAAATGIPVLISADPIVAQWIARVIHDRSERRTESFTSYHPGTGDQLAFLKRLLNGWGPRRGTLFVTDVSRVKPDVQAFLRDLLAAPQSDATARFRMIAGTSKWLYQLVERGEFDDFLFYRLNKIHIRVGLVETAEQPDSVMSRDIETSVNVTKMDVAAFRRNRMMLRGGHLPLQALPANAFRHG
jgi:hypothetical protein